MNDRTITGCVAVPGIGDWETGSAPARTVLGKQPMSEYRIYTLTSDGHISAPSAVVECADDQEALQKARQAVNGHDVELWNGRRLVTRLPQDK